VMTLPPSSAWDVRRAEDLLEAGHKRAVAEEEVIAYAERMDAQVRLRWENGWGSACTGPEASLSPCAAHPSRQPQPTHSSALIRETPLRAGAVTVSGTLSP
jgi:hypothetical protein